MQTKELEKTLLNETDKDTLQRIVDDFNLDLQKKDIIRKSKLANTLDAVAEQMTERVLLEPEDFSNLELLDYFKTIQNSLQQQKLALSELQVPSVQINQQININNNQLNSESRKKVLSAVSSILDNPALLQELDLTELEEAKQEEEN